MKIFCICTLIIFSLNNSIVLAQTFERQIQSSSDDAEEKQDGSYVTTSSSDLELTYDTWNSQGLQTIGLRFDDISIPANSIVTNAYIQFTADGSSSGDISISISGEDIANSFIFSDQTNNVSGRNQTSESVIWSSIPSWSEGQAGVNQRTPNLSSIVEEIITSNGWQNGNPISFILTGTGSETVLRKAYSFDEDANKSAKLVIEYSAQSDIDLAISAIVSPTETFYPNSSAVIQAEILSYGNLSASNYSVSYSIDGNLMAIEPGTTDLQLGETIIFSFAQTADLSAIDTYSLMVEVSIDNDEDVSNNTFTQSISIINEVDSLFFNEGVSWRYWDNSSDPGATWNTTEYNDSIWPVGTAHFGFGDGDEQTVLNGNLTSYYFRKKINIDQVNELDEVYFHLIHDEGAIIYINDQEAFRTEMMPLGTISHNTPARQSCNSTNQNEFYTYKVDTNLFVSGINTIAISIRNRSSADSDLSFDCFITPTFSYSQDGPYVYYQGNDIIVEEVTPTGLISSTYTSSIGVELTCTLPHMNTSFSFPLKTEINIEPSIYDTTPSKFLTISDFDGHIESFTMILQDEGIIDENFNWIYGEGHLVISGDLFDRGFHITECMWLLYKLESEAEMQGGKVHLIIGNHEMMNMEDDWRYVEVKYFNSAHLMGKRMSELYDSNTELGRWLRSKNIIEKIGDYAVMHGGMSPQVAALNLTYDQINDYGRIEMDGNCPTNNCVTVNGSDGIYWYRGMAYEDLSQQVVDDILDSLGVQRVIIGHTKENTIRSLYNGRVLAIDMYHMDNFQNGYMEALQFEIGCFYIFHTTNSNQTYTQLGECDEFNTNVLQLNGKDQLQIYPNPTAANLNIKLPYELMGEYAYNIVNLEGKVVKSGFIQSELSSIDLNTFSTGKYFLTLKNSSKTITGSFILKN